MSPIIRQGQQTIPLPFYTGSSLELTRIECVSSDALFTLMGNKKNVGRCDQP